MASGLFTPILKLIGLSSASFLTAWIASFSLIGIPAVQMAPTDLGARQWSKIFHLGMSTAPPFAITCSACFAYLAYQSRNSRGRFAIRPAYLYGAAAVLAPCIVPYTRTVMWSGVQALELRVSGEAGAPSDQAFADLIEIWKAQNLNRALFVAASAFLAAIAMLA